MLFWLIIINISIKNKITNILKNQCRYIFNMKKILNGLKRVKTFKIKTDSK